MRTIILSVGLLSAAGTAPACDLCSIYSTMAARGEVDRGVHAALAGQFTHFGTLREDSRKAPNPEDEYLDSSITQGIVGYNFSDRVGVQLNVPWIHRRFRRAGETGPQNGTSTGIGDLSLTGHWQFLRRETMNSTFAWHAIGGIKFPTGDTGRLAEEADEDHGHGEGQEHAESGIHGHDLTRGSGSVDGVLGTGIYARRNRFFFNASVQWAIRSEGDFDYRFADDVMWQGGPGMYLALEDELTFAVQVVCSGETKGRDEFEGEKVGDTGFTAVYLGPQLSLTWSDRLSFDLSAERPVHIRNTGLQATPDYRVRAAVSLRF